MSRLLILGGDGLLGSHLYLALRASNELCLTLHGDAHGHPPQLFDGAQVACGVAAGDSEQIARLLDRFRPDWVINGIGLVKRDLAADACASLEANTVLPHQLARLCGERALRLLHFSTDCVYAGTTGMYREAEPPDCQDWHGRCKALGEPAGAHVLVLRTSFIGLELGCKRSLLEWFLAQRGRVPGYRRAIWSGLSAIEIGRLVDLLVNREDPLSGLWHVAGPPITKYELLSALNARLGERGVSVVADDAFVCDRSLDGSALRTRTGYVPPGWDRMLDELAEDIRERWAPAAPSYWRF